MAIKRKAAAQGPPAKRPKTTDDCLTALKKLLPGKSAQALGQVAAWFEKEIDVTTFADLESADTWASEVHTLLELDETLSIGCRGLIKELMRILSEMSDEQNGEAVEDEEEAMEPEPEEDYEEDVEEPEPVEEEQEEEQEEAEEEAEEEAPPPPAPTPKAKAKAKVKVTPVAVKTAIATKTPMVKPAAKPVAKAAARTAVMPVVTKSAFARAFLEPPAKLSKEEMEQVEAMREEIEVRVDDKIGKQYTPVTTFEELGVFPEYVMEAMAGMGIEAPLPIQAQALPIALGGHDVTGIAKTGSGKTLAYLLPAIVHIEAQPPIKKGGVPSPIALVLAPTRELVVQIHEEAAKLVRESKGKGNHPGGLWSACIYGGRSKDEQLRLARLGTHIMAATPGRLADNIRSKEISLQRVTFFVLDEADRMLDEGFGDELAFFSKQIRKDRHMLFFSATWPKEVESLARDMCHGGKKPVHLAVGQASEDGPTTRDSILQEVVCFRQRTWEERDAAKKELLFNHCREVLSEEENKILVFVSSKNLADELRNTLWEEGFKTESMHGGRTQETRLSVLNLFKTGEVRLLVATDVMGRGLDIPDISHVVIYDMGEVDDYVHRIGRTARGPSGQGHALTFYEFDPKWPEIPGGLVKVLEESGQEVPDDLREIAEECEGMEPVGRKSRRKKGSGINWEADDEDSFGNGFGNGFSTSMATTTPVAKKKAAASVYAGAYGGNGAGGNGDDWEEDGWGGAGGWDLLQAVAQAAWMMGKQSRR